MCTVTSNQNQHNIIRIVHWPVSYSFVCVPSVSIGLLSSPLYRSHAPAEISTTAGSDILNCIHDVQEAASVRQYPFCTLSYDVVDEQTTSIANEEKHKQMVGILLLNYKGTKHEWVRSLGAKSDPT